MHGENSGSISTTLNRRRFLKIGGAGVAGVALFGVLGSSEVTAQQGSLKAEFKAAAKKYKVPLPLLLAIGYVNTRFKMPPPGASDYEKKSPSGKGLYGIMALVQNPSSDTLGQASQLTGISEEKLKTDRASNIMGGAALLAASQGNKPRKLGEWLGAVADGGGRGRDFQAIAGIGGGQIYAEQVSAALTSGVSANTESGERVDLAPQSLASRVLEEVL